MATLIKSVSVPAMAPLMAPRLWLPNPTAPQGTAKRKITVFNDFGRGLEVRELTSDNAELRSLIESLRRIDYAATFAVRTLIDNILNRRLVNARVFVSEIGNFAHSTDTSSSLKAVSVIYRLYPDEKWSTEEIDNVAFWAIDQNSATSHLRSLDSKRRWQSRGVVFVNFRDDLLPALEQIFADSSRRLVTPQPASRLYISEPYTKKELEKRLVQYSKKMPPNLVFDRLKPEDAEIVAENWDFARPRKTDYVRWLIEEFVGVCVRDTSKNNLPVSWGLVNEFGAKGFKFVLPEYRRHGLSVSNMYALLLAYSDPNYLSNKNKRTLNTKSDQETSTQVFYALVSDENEASIRGNAKARFVPTDVRCTRLVYRKRVLFEQFEN